MPKTPLKIALLTGNNSPGEHYLVRLLRSEFENVIVVAVKPSKPARRTLRYILGTTWRIAYLSAKNMLLSYKYPIRTLIRTKPKADIEQPDINSEIVFKTLEEFSPNVICIYGTKKIEDRILELADKSLNIHNGFVPYYRGVSSGHWTSLESNFSYFNYSIHKATSIIDAGEIYSSQPVSPYFFESLPDHQYRQSILAARAMLIAVKNISSGKDQSFEQPDLGGRNLRHKHKPAGFTSNARSKFVSKNGRLYKRIVPRSNRLENFLVKYVFSELPKNLANGWFVLNYHAITLEDDFEGHGLPGIITSFKRFKEHVDFYSREFDLVSIPEGLKQVESGSATNTRYLSITFDDAFKLPDAVLEILGSKNCKPGLFLNSDPIIRKTPLDNHSKYLRWLFNKTNPDETYETWVKSQYLDLEDIHQMLNQNLVDIGSHTASHARLNHLQIDVLKDQIYGAHKELEQHLNTNIPYFAFPYGGLRDRTFLAEYEAMQVSDQYFACEGGINQNLVSGAILRIGAHNESEPELIKLLLRQYVR